MAVTSGQVALGATGAAAIVVPAANPNVNQSQSGYRLANRDVFLSNSGATVYLGGTTGVTTSTGCPLATGQTLKLSLHLDEAICAVPNGATGSTVSFLAAGS